MKRFILLLLSLALIGPAAARTPNVIFILTDDQGYGDLSAHGNPVLKTPNLDRLRGESVRFTNFYVSPTCAPTRSALLTGRHEFRNGVTHTILERERLALSAITLPQLLKTAGYTTGIFGKWHLGDEPDYQPGRRGFDEVFIHGGGGIGQTYPGSCGDAPGNTYFDPAILHNGRFEKTKGFCTDVFFNQAIDWIGSRKDSGPFFCWVATNAPHSPYTAKPEDRARYAGKGLGADTENFFGMIHNIDENTGRLLAKLDEWNLARDTLVVMMNDNGGTAGVKVFNAGMRAAKVTPWLGGTRAFSFWRWPATFRPADCPALTAHVDILRTITGLAGVTHPPQLKPRRKAATCAPCWKTRLRHGRTARSSPIPAAGPKVPRRRAPNTATPPSGIPATPSLASVAGTNPRGSFSTCRPTPDKPATSPRNSPPKCGGSPMRMKHGGSPSSRN